MNTQIKSDPIKDDISADLAEQFHDSGLGTTEIAKRLNVSPSAISNIKTGNTHSMSLALLNQISKDMGKIYIKPTAQIIEIPKPTVKIFTAREFHIINIRDNFKNLNMTPHAFCKAHGLGHSRLSKLLNGDETNCSDSWLSMVNSLIMKKQYEVVALTIEEETTERVNASNDPHWETATAIHIEETKLAQEIDWKLYALIATVITLFAVLIYK